LDAGDDDGDRRFPRKFLADIVKESKMAEEKAVGRFGLGKRRWLATL
jgi:hypothetical protein